jgi:muramoyltetrapeptide carboxypeptidase LdcA involved in peptidoglycan recycling
MRYPENLPKGGTIGFLAPSFGCDTEPYKSSFDNALKKWQREGYKTLLGPNCHAGKGVGISNTPQKCGEEVMEMFTSDADALISCGGGELMCEILPYVDFEALSKAEPKWFMGYSDNTNLTYLLATLADTASVYGPCASNFGMKEPLHSSLTDAFGVLTGECRTVRGYGMWEKESQKDAENPFAPYNLTEALRIRSFRGTKEVTGEELAFSGRLIGGCMDCLVTLLGTRFDRTGDFLEKYKEDGFIWFLEACDLNVFSIRRAMWQMEEAGWFQHVKGFLIGRPLNGAPMMNLDAYDAVLAVAGRKNVPVVMDVDLGHTPPMMPLIVGSMAKVRTKGNDIEIRMELL